jgi:hypothetical protein
VGSRVLLQDVSCFKPKQKEQGDNVERYKNLGGDSGVAAYELGSGTIVVQFKDGWKYEYTNQRAGAAAIATMHRLAASGQGLNRFISTTARKAYSRKFR